MDEATLKEILTTPKNALVKQYQRLLEIDGVKLTFESDAISSIARKAMNKGTGARGLRAIVERTMLSLMYEIPSRRDVVELVVTQDSIEQDEAQPRVVTSTVGKTGT